MEIPNSELQHISMAETFQKWAGEYIYLEILWKSY